MLNIPVAILSMLIVGALGLALCLVGDARQRPMLSLLGKSVASASFLVVGFLGLRRQPVVLLLFLGLVFGAEGDILLAFPSTKSFVKGLVSFLLGHVLYLAAFLVLSPLAWPGLVALALAAAGSAAVYFWLAPHLGAMRLPVIAYIVVITLMVAASGLVLVDLALPFILRVMLPTGAVLFYISDLFVARNRFVVKEFRNRLVGLPIYYAAQFLIALALPLIVSGAAVSAEPEPPTEPISAGRATLLVGHHGREIALVELGSSRALMRINGVAAEEEGLVLEYSVERHGRDTVYFTQIHGQKVKRLSVRKGKSGRPEWRAFLPGALGIGSAVHPDHKRSAQLEVPSFLAQHRKQKAEGRLERLRQAQASGVK